MSLYNMLHGKNPAGQVLLAMLDLKEYDCGRFRDCFLNEDGTVIHVYTRNGGGNREDYQETNDALAAHPQYMTDYDDDFDCTYATFEFKVPDEYLEITKSVATGEKLDTIGDKFKKTLEALEQKMTPKK